jgi:aminoglycoside phosphotransferase (APT) family kinase protein
MMARVQTADSDAAERLSAYIGIVATVWDGSFGHDAVRLRAGQDHDVLVLGTEAVFRFPRTRRAYEASPREVAALAALQDLGIGVVLPDVLLDRSGEPLGTAFTGHRYLHGEPLPRGSVDAVGPMAYRFAMELARVLDALASVEVTPALAEALTRAPVRDDFADLAAAVRERLGPRMSAEGRDRAEGELAAVLALVPPARPALVHGDFGGTNLRWDADETRLTGVLDWGQVHLGDPAYDIASVGATYGWDLAATVHATTEREDPSLLDRARAYAGTFALQEALAGVVDGDEVAARRGLKAYA